MVSMRGGRINPYRFGWYRYQSDTSVVVSTVSLSPQRLVVANFHQRIVMSVQTPSFLSHLALHTLAFTPLLLPRRPSPPGSRSRLSVGCPSSCTDE